MSGSTQNARIWTGADVFHAPVGTTGPTNLATSLNVAFHAVGLLGTDGLTETRDEDSTDHWAWGGILIRTVKSKHKRTFKFIALEDNKETFALANPGSTVGAPASGICVRTVKVPTENPRAWVFQLADGDDVSRRLYIPKAEAALTGDIVYSEEELEAKEFEVTVYPDDSGVLFQIIGNDLAFAS